MTLLIKLTTNNLEKLELTEKCPNRKNQIRLLTKYPIGSFIIISFIITYGLGIPFNMWISQNFKLTEPFDIYLPRLVTVFSPGIAALILIWQNKKRVQLNRFLPKRNLLYIYLIIPILTLMLSIISLILGGLTIDKMLAILQSNWDQLFIHLILQISIIGIGEEMGWRGWLLPNLNKKYSLIKTIFLVWIIWTLWHFPILFSDSEILIPWLFIISAATIILTWTWKKFGNNILLFALIHGSINYPQFFWESQTDTIDSELLITSWRISAYFYLVIGIIAFISLRKNLRDKNTS